MSKQMGVALCQYNVITEASGLWGRGLLTCFTAEAVKVGFQAQSLNSCFEKEGSDYRKQSFRFSLNNQSEKGTGSLCLKVSFQISKNNRR